MSRIPRRAVLFLVLTITPAGAGDAGRATMSATYRELTAFPGSLIPGEVDWSPVGQVLLLNKGQGGGAVVDVRSGDLTPREITNMRVRRACWAPDGRWIVFETRTYHQHKTGVSSLYATAADGTVPRPVPLLESREVGGFAWGDDGFIYHSNVDSGGPSKLTPPADWLASYARPERVRPLLLGKRGVHRADPYVFWPGEQEDKNVHITRFAADRRNLVVFLDRFPRHDWFLLRIYEPTIPGYDMILGATGQVVVIFRGKDVLENLMRNSVSSDGSFIVAYDSRDDGHNVTSSKMYLVDPRGDWRVEIQGAPMGLDPRLSKSGHLIAFEDLDGGIHVGELHVTSR